MDTNVCKDQETFDKAVKHAIEHINDDEKGKQNHVAKVIVTLIMLTLLLAMKVSDPQQRVLHVIFALFTGPLYVLAYYLGMLQDMDSDKSMSSDSDDSY
jgi:bacteriorhodopsin